jgi:hypothetical protein
MSPQLQPGQYVYCFLPEGASLPSDCRPFALIHELEGQTVILPRPDADRLGWRYDYIAALITLTIQSDLTAVGMTAAVARVLAQAGISCNVVAAFYHDHLLVPAGQASAAMAALQALSGSPNLS